MAKMRNITPIRAKIIENTQNEEKIKKIEPTFQGIILFFSYDFVNSTYYKTQNVAKWMDIFNDVFGDLNDRVMEAMPGAVIWRILGDEIIYVVNVNNEDTLCEYIRLIYKILFEENKWLDKKKIELSFKCAAWIGLVSNQDKSEFYNRTLQYDIDLAHGRSIFEFIGNDIDAGFRIKQKTFSGQLILSFELASLYIQKIQQNEQIIILGYSELKGIWNGRLYPIIIYYDKKYFFQKNYMDTLPYDIVHANSLIAQYYAKIEKTYDSKIVQTQLEKITSDIGLKEKMDLLRKSLDTPPTGWLVDAMRNRHELYLHIAVVCCCFDEKRVLIAQRSSERDKLSGVWEFGCAKAVKSECINTTVIKDYEKDFPGIKMELIMNKKREKNYPKPYAIYEVPLREDSSQSDKGIIVYAKILNTSLDEIKKTAKHQQLKFITEDELDDFCSKTEYLVPDFKDTLQYAFNLINSEIGK